MPSLEADAELADIPDAFARNVRRDQEADRPGLPRRDPVEALVRGTLPRAMGIGRTVPLALHSRTHPGARSTVLRLCERYRDDPRVTIAVFENPAGREVPCLVRRNEEWRNRCPEDSQEELPERLTLALREQMDHGRIGRAVYEGALGVSAGYERQH